MTKSPANHHIKYLAGAAFIVFIWFAFRLGFRENASERIGHLAHPFGNTPPSTASGSITGGKVLSATEAEDYCQHYRLKPFSREKVAARKIYDLLLVNTELEMLEVRMGQMAPYVDYFVILESDKTFTDKTKPLYIKENWDRFAPYHSKMILRTMDLEALNFDGSTWDRETKSRNAMYSQVIPGLTGEQAASRNDVLLVSDVDEIPKPEILNALRNCAFPERVTIHSEIYYYSYQWRARNDWPHPQATIYQGETTVLPDDLRKSADNHHFMYGGWHCSYCFSTVEEMVSKLTSFSHSELDKPEFKDPPKLVNRIRRGTDLFERPDAVFDRIDNNHDVPDFLKHNNQKYMFMLNRDPPNANFRDYAPPSAST